MKAPDWQGTAFTEAGVPQFEGGEAFDLRFRPWFKVIHTHLEGVGIFRCSSPAELPWWEATIPLRVLLHIGRAEGRAESWSKISEMLRRVPVMRWHLAPQIATNVQRFPFAPLRQPQRIAVIMPAFNPGPEISCAWETIRRQDWIRASVRLIIIHDSNTDAEAVGRMQQLAAAFP